MARLLESLTTRTLLGIGFFDPAANLQISDSLSLTAWPETAPDLKVHAFRTASGNFAFQNLPGMREFEYPPAGSDPLLGSPPAPRPFIVEVKDNRNTFMAIRVRVELPLPENGLFTPTPISSPPPGMAPRFYLFSAPSRAAAPGQAAVRATLTAPDDETPAAYVLLELEEHGRRWYGLTDDRGCATILFPYPTFITALGTSPPGLPPSDQHWPVTIRARYDPELYENLDENDLPTIQQIRNQPAALLWPTEAGPGDSAVSFELTYGRELILRTGSRSHLWVETP